TPRGGDVTVVELAGHERAGTGDPSEFVPHRSHRAGAHAPKRFGQAGDAIVHPLSSHLRNERRPAALEPGEHREAAPVVDEGLEPVLLYALRHRLVTPPPALARVLIEPGVRADGEERKDALRPRGGDMEGEASAHRVA